MVYVTQTRAIPAPVLQYFDRDRKTANTGLFNLVHPITGGSQTTTSWRTGRQYSDDDGSHRYFGATHGEFEKSLVDEYRQQPGTFDNGHTFSTQKNYLGVHSKRVRILGKPNGTADQKTYWYEGDIFIDPLYSAMGAPRAVYPSPQGAYTGSTVDGTKAISLTTPTVPAANLAQGLAELVREGFPRAVGHTLLNPKFYDPRNFGDEFLNLKFGIQPLINDVRQAAHAVVNAGKILRQLERDSGRNVRRQMSFPEEKSASVVNGTGILYYNTQPSKLVSCFDSVGGPSTTIIQTSRRRWFSGAFTYVLPPGYHSYGKVRAAEEKAKYLLGLDLNAEVLYNLTPWSWLADWFANIGDVVANVTRFASSDSLVLRYGYIMCESQTHMTRIVSGLSTYAGGALGDLLFESGVIRKERYRSSPFGFGLVTSGFSQGQWDILAALGMSRSPGSLTQDL